MSKRKHLRVKMRNSLHGVVIAIPRNVDRRMAANILAIELRQRTPVDTGNALQGWDIRELSRGDMRAFNDVPYIRRLMIDGYSKQEAKRAYSRAIKAARLKINVLGLATRELELVEERRAVPKEIEEEVELIMRSVEEDVNGE